MWNLNYTTPTFLILLVFLIYYVARPKMKMRINNTFVWLLMADAATMIADYVSTWMDMENHLHSDAALYVANILFFCFFILRNYLIYLFTVDVLKLRLKLDELHIVISLGVLVFSELAAIASPWLHTLFYIDDFGYHRGDAYNIIYVQFLYYVIVSIILLVAKGRHLPQFEYYTVLAYNVLLLAGLMIRYMFPQVLIMNLFCLLVIALQFLTFQNPNNYIDKDTRLFNRLGFETAVNEVIETRKKKQLLGFVIKNYTDDLNLYGTEQMYSGLASIAEYLRADFGKYGLYYLGNGQFILEGSEGEDMSKVMANIDDRFKSSWKGRKANLYLKPGFVMDNEHEHFSTVELYMDCLQTLFSRADTVGTGEVMRLNRETRAEWEREVNVKRAVEKAIADGRVDVHLQPIVDAETQQLVGAEALARIKDPVLGPIMPGDFISLAEENGSIIALGEQVFRKTCNFLAEYGDMVDLQWINVNLSPIQCMNRELPEEFTRITEITGVSPEKIHLEITEQECADWDLLSQQVLSLTERGFAFVLDDYGTGYSNIERIKSLPIINVKMDMSIIRDYCREEDTLLPLSVIMVKNMGFTVTAEGVEDQSMAEKMKDIGCNFLQGYCFSKPLGMDDFLEKYRNDK